MADRRTLEELRLLFEASHAAEEKLLKKKWKEYSKSRHGREYTKDRTSQLSSIIDRLRGILGE